ncbi:hypothetical protein ACQP1G_39255 [Nocardia sp. CA-107356]
MSTSPRAAISPKICRNPYAPGRPWVAHATDEFSIEEATRPIE